MREIKRIIPFVLKIAELWAKCVPDWRFGQLMYNFIAATGDPFYYEEDDFLDRFENYLKNL